MAHDAGTAGKAAQQECGCGKKHRRRRWLGGVQEVPPYQRRDYILSYYRLERPRLHHFWAWHNETGNIWTHILAGTYMLYRFVTWITEVQAHWDMAYPRALYLWGIIAYFMTSLIVFSISVQYHWRMCSPQKEFLCWRCLDHSACLAVVIMGYFSGIPMGFHCFPTLRTTYATASLAIVLAMVVMLSLTPARHSETMCQVLIFGAFLAVLPAAHWLVIANTSAEVKVDLLMSILFACMAVAVFLSMFPECRAPGRFDLVGSSHQIWHVLIFLTIVKYGDVLTAVYALTASDAHCR